MSLNFKGQFLQACLKVVKDMTVPLFT